MFIFTDSGWVIDESNGTLREFADGAWGPVRSPLEFGELMGEDSRELSAEEVATLEKSGKLS